jgi:NAD-dependent dihydropyrimidine dehydrogenase PreA subunit
MVKIDASKCNSCGTCIEICPVEGVKIIDGKAVANEQCVECGTCINCCPTQAISQ